MPCLRYNSKLIFVFLIGITLASCASKKTLYRPNEVADLSYKLGIEIKNDDPDMPLFAETSTWLGTKYKAAGLSRGGVDCSGFTHLIYKKIYKIDISRSSAEQAKNVRNISKSKLRTGDLVFFATSSKNRNQINHVGIYLKNDQFIHASTSRGVIVSSLNEDYYRKAWKKGGRVK